MSVIASTNIDNDDELRLDARTWDKLKQIDVEDAHKYMSDDSEDSEDLEQDPELRAMKKMEAKDDEEQRKLKGEVDGDDESDVSSDEELDRIDRMANEIEDRLK
jgi:hypothetical protein